MALVDEVILPLPYFGNLSHYARLIQQDAWIDIHEHFVKQTLRNRTELCSSQGKLNLTVPVVKISGKKQAMCDIKVSYVEDWQGDHWKSITSSYGASPFLIHYADELEAFYRNKYEKLLDLNLASHKLVDSILGSELDLRLSGSYLQGTYGTDYRNSYKLGLAESPPYIQVFSDRIPFTPDLSILDLILCMGPESLDYLKNHPI